MQNKTQEAINHIKTLDKDSNDFVILRTEIENKVKDSTYELTRSHGVAKEYGGSNGKNNIFMVQWWIHQNLHKFFGNLLPHQALYYLLKVHCKSLRGDIINKVEKNISGDPKILYKKSVIKNERNFEKLVKKGSRIYRI